MSDSSDQHNGGKYVESKLESIFKFQRNRFFKRFLKNQENQGNASLGFFLTKDRILKPLHSKNMLLSNIGEILRLISNLKSFFLGSDVIKWPCIDLPKILRKKSQETRLGNTFVPVDCKVQTRFHKERDINGGQATEKKPFKDF